MKKIVFITEQERHVITYEIRLVLSAFDKNLNTNPDKSPVSILGTKHINNVYIKLIFNKAVPNGSIPKHCIKLVNPNIPPNTAPDIGPDMIAPIATGTVIKVIATVPIFK